ncbi:hypothetical protein [Rheinheimera maricola]|uniref:Sulfotransferase domain-containing protein n=1 Tax=Rheinheimera maricola TaxID=2793282 RepID=A0ABS7X427_9GAMM|nr:hypothetical protein [Rheinheimera maricola]MBZ9610314.1 sulfotransferase domain-containing protein [Rheinheimera maricola]
MSKQQDTMPNLSELQLQLQQALALIENNNINKPDVALTDLRSFHNTESLLQRCEQVVQASQPQKPILRIIHHFACSGGTLISKCIAAQPNVFLLSELHPTTLLGFNSNKGTYTPRDILTQALYSRIPDIDTLAETVFVQNVIETERHVRERGGYLVLRAHTHADYCTNAAVPEVDSLTRLLSPHFDIKQLVTVRNPIDSFLSLRQNGWVHFKPDSFDEYCGRLLKFLNAFSEEQIVKYEDFVEQPDTVVKTCLQKLGLPIVTYGLDYIDVFKVSGDSGRSSAEIAPRPRKEVSESFKLEVTSSKAFAEINRKFFYQGIN